MAKSRKRVRAHNVGKRCGTLAKHMAAITRKAYRGPGGWRCQCCRIGTRAWMKVHIGRAVRRKLKQSILSATP